MHISHWVIQYSVTHLSANSEFLGNFVLEFTLSKSRSLGQPTHSFMGLQSVSAEAIVQEYTMSQKAVANSFHERAAATSLGGPPLPPTGESYGLQKRINSCPELKNYSLETKAMQQI